MILLKIYKIFTIKFLLKKILLNVSIIYTIDFIKKVIKQQKQCILAVGCLKIDIVSIPSIFQIKRTR